MKTHLSFYLSLVFFLINSCTEDYQFPNMEKQTTIVITGLVTNEPGPYYVTVWEYISDMTTGNTAQRPINDARVTIADSNGHVDELRSFFSVPIETELIESPYPPYSWYNEFYRIPDDEGGYAIFSAYEYWLNEKKDSREGKYFTTSTKGQSGLTYTLKVEYAGQEYISTDYMCYGTVIDSVSLEPKGIYIYDKPDGSDNFMVPCLYFAEPQDETNYYMFDAYSIENDHYFYITKFKDMVLRPITHSRYKSWPISVISDRFLPPYVYQYKISDGDDVRKYLSSSDIGFYDWEWQDFGVINMQCITEPVYRYYYALSRQYYDDGGVFSPSPASPPTNFSGGAQGCFSAASVSQYVLDMRKDK